MTEALAPAKPQIDDPQELDRVVQRLVEAFDRVAVYLFGSRARSDAGEDSDYDLMLVLADDNERVRFRQDVWQTGRSRRIFVNTFLSRTGSFAWRRHHFGTLEYEVQVDGIRLYPAAGASDRERCLALDRFSDYVWAHRDPGEEHGRPPPPLPSLAEARAWIAEVAAFQVDFERGLAQREAQP